MPAGRQHGDLVAVPVGDAGALEDPIDDGFLGVGLAAGDLGVAGDRGIAATESPARGRTEQAARRRGGGRVVRIIACVTTGCSALSRDFVGFRPAVCAQSPRGIRPPRNIDSIRAVRRFMPGGLLAELAGEKSNREIRVDQSRR